jgi:hypothetical protein
MNPAQLQTPRGLTSLPSLYALIDIDKIGFSQRNRTAISILIREALLPGGRLSRGQVHVDLCAIKLARVFENGASGGIRTPDGEVISWA